MSENNNVNDDEAIRGSLRPESQADRWIKYGSNVALSLILVVVLAVLATWFAQRADARLDLTAGGSLSLKPQTANILRDVDQKITLVSLYSRPDGAPDKVAMAQRVSDLLDEYKSKSRQIDIRVIDPLKEHDKLEELHQEFINRYGNNLKAYKDYLEQWRKEKYEQIRQAVAAEKAMAEPISKNPIAGNEYGESPEGEFVRTVGDVIPDLLQNLQQAVDKELAKKHPDYRAASQSVEQVLKKVSEKCDQIIQDSQALPPLSEPFKKYWKESVPRFKDIKKLTDDFAARADTLGELKVDQLEQALNIQNPILVLGSSEWRILPPSQLWQVDADAKIMANGGTLAPRFVGEQQITTAIYSLAHPKKQKICFVRSGGPPVTQGMMYRMMSGRFLPAVPEGEYRAIAERLRQYNFDVTERDLSGMWPMQAERAQIQPVVREPSPEEIKDAVWVVSVVGGEQGAGPSIVAQLKEHLNSGGSALVLCEPRGDALIDPLKDWGVELHPEAIAVHEPVKLSKSNGDPLEEAIARSYIFDCRNYGDHLLAKAIRNLDSVFVAPIVVRTHDVGGFTVTPLLPFTDNANGQKTWGETDFESLQAPAFDSKTGDLPAPVYGGAAVEKNGGGRLVVYGTGTFMTNHRLFVPDYRMLQGEHPMVVNRFPGNMELATNTFFWLSRLDPMIAISPSAMDVSRIEDMSPKTLNFWRVGVLLILLPGAVLVGGAMMYLARRD